MPALPAKLFPCRASLTSNARAAASIIPPTVPQTVCPKDGGILYARYDLASIKKTFSPASLLPLAPTMWRYDAVLPEAKPVSLGEGFTPMLRSREYPNVFIKDEGLNPTGSFKARGLSAAVTMARHFGLKKLAIPSAGNAAGALAAYAAAAGIEAHIFMPKDVPMANRIECDYYGAHVTLVDGLISDCAAQSCGAERKPASWKREGWFDVSTTKEPYRVEGQEDHGLRSCRTTGLETSRRASFIPPAAALACWGCGRPLMRWSNWVSSAPSARNMISVQSAGCAPIVKAWDEGRPVAEMWPHASTLASGLRVPKPYGDYLILDILKKSGGLAIAATDAEILDATRHWAKVEGIFAAPEGAASLVAYQKLLASEFLHRRRYRRALQYRLGSEIS